MSKPSIVDAINEFNKWSATELVQAYDGNTGKAAAAIAGVPYEKGVSKNMEYKAARRNLERYMKSGRTPKADMQAKMNKAGRKTQKGKPIGITFAGTFNIGGSDTEPDREREINRTYSPEQWDTMSELAEAKNEEGVWAEVALEYHVSSMEQLSGKIIIGED